jgi:rubrerythrin
MQLTVLAVGFGLLFRSAAAQTGAPAAQHQLLLAYREDVNEHARYLAYADRAQRRTCGHVARGHAPDRCPVSLSSAEAFVRID